MRTIVLSGEELTEARKRFGTFYPLGLDVLVAPEGDRALIDWDEGWRGGSFSAELKDGKWTLTETGSWVS